MTTQAIDSKIMQALLNQPGMKKKTKGMGKDTLAEFKSSLVRNKIYFHFAQSYAPAEEEITEQESEE